MKTQKSKLYHCFLWIGITAVIVMGLLAVAAASYCSIGISGPINIS